MPGRNCQDRIYRIGLTGQDYQGRTDRTAQPVEDRKDIQERTARTGQPE
jgi:hypothetical protein